jgi:SAM-dependent methyltransferase
MHDRDRDRTRARQLAAEFLRKGDPMGWFEALYQEGQAGKSVVPWADGCVNPHLLGFWHAHPQVTARKHALVVGCALGDDVEQLARWGFETSGFDISETAIRGAKKRFPHTKVRYLAADLFSPPNQLLGKFDFVFEANTLQALPAAIRLTAMQKIAQFLAPGGLLLVVARGREPSDPEGEMPWPLTREELSTFTRVGLQEISFEDFFDADDPPVRRLRALYRAPNNK